MTPSVVTPPRISFVPIRPAGVLAPAALLACLLWSYWTTIAELCVFWWRNEDYSVGMLVPPVAAFLLWRMRAHLVTERVRPHLIGVAALLAAQAVRFAGLYYGSAALERYSIVLTIAAVVLLAAGPRVFWRVRWVMAFLLLMVPLPTRVHESVLLPLQGAATSIAVFVMELLGFFVSRQGNVIRLDERFAVAVAEACSGLRMLSAFVFVMAVLVALIRRPLWQKALVLASSVPLAVAANALRIAATAILMYWTNDPTLEDRIHSIAGFVMMPVAVAAAFGLLRVLAVLAPDSVESESGRDGAAGAAPGAPGASRGAVPASGGLLAKHTALLDRSVRS